MSRFFFSLGRRRLSRQLKCYLFHILYLTRSRSRSRSEGRSRSRSRSRNIPTTTPHPWSFLFNSEKMMSCYYMTSQPMVDQVHWHRPIRSVHSADQPHGEALALNQLVVDKRIVVDGFGSKAIFGWARRDYAGAAKWKRCNKLGH